jgi:hypothetical protein
MAWYGKRKVIETYHSHLTRVPEVILHAAGNRQVCNRLSQSMSGMEQAPGPRGSPQLPQAPALGDALAEPFVDIAKTESCCASFLLWHLGHFASWLP